MGVELIASTSQICCLASLFVLRWCCLYYKHKYDSFWRSESPIWRTLDLGLPSQMDTKPESAKFSYRTWYLLVNEISQPAAEGIHQFIFKMGLKGTFLFIDCCGSNCEYYGQYVYSWKFTSVPFRWLITCLCDDRQATEIMLSSEQFKGYPNGGFTSLFFMIEIW